MRHNDVAELQKRLAQEGVYSGPITGFFGNLTRAAVIRYQKAHNITPAIGFVGPITRGVLNSTPAANQQANVAIAAEDQVAAIAAKIQMLKQKVQELLARLSEMQNK